MRRTCRHILAACTLAATATLTACGDSTDPDQDPLPDNAATAVGLTVRDNVEASLDAFFPARLLQPLTTGEADDPCVNSSPATDTDGDGVPDEANYTFTAPPCRYTGVRGFSLDIVGQIRIVDPAPETAGFGADITLTGLRFGLSAEESDLEYDVTRNGTITLTGSAAGLEQDVDLQVLRTFSGFSDASVEHVWTIGFDPETTLQINQPLPSGSVTVAGTVAWTRGQDEQFNLTITTATPLHYDATCESAGQRFDDGELRIAGTFGETPGYVRIAWERCGDDPDIGFVADE
ncbi:MAG TPA: hypothetical protein VG500_12195 [Gemmatimonadales bacterium]|nr:hypothetical protein [Gemmatimonadales bacterium]